MAKSIIPMFLLSIFVVLRSHTLTGCEMGHTTPLRRQVKRGPNAVPWMPNAGCGRKAKH